MSVFVISQNCLVRDLIVASCKTQDFPVADVADALDAIETPEAGDVVLLHTQTARRALYDDIVALRRRQPAVRIVVVAAPAVYNDIHTSLRGQIEALLQENQPADVLMGTLSVVRAGYRVLHDDHARKGRLPDPNAPRDARDRATAIAQNASGKPARLSPRESVILRKLCAGRTNKDIANELGICQATVKVHLRACYRKIGAKNRTQAAVWAAERL